ncbi:hypothetical protein SAMN04487889_1333 [Eubacterium pyruvativorans]|nr:hypothetical protein SAMN04487889_1333 [Eubacterium pyruvativorans]
MKRVKAACICQTLHFMLKDDLGHDYAVKLVKEDDYYGAAEPPVRWWRSHLSGLSEPPRMIIGYLAFSGSNP